MPDVAGKHGVSVFFVLSGYLITRVLLREETTDFRAFYLRRARRLLPALLLAVATAWMFGWVEGWGLVWPLTYSTNFALAAGYGHYPLSHTWSLAIEEHFYLVWPVVLLLIGRRWKPALWLSMVAFVWAVYATGTADSFLSYQWSTDSHAFMLFAGCALALARHHRVVASFPSWAGVVGVVGVVAASYVPAVGWDRGLILKTLPVVFALIAVNSDRNVLLEHRVLAWFGLVSYGLYLWHGLLLKGTTLPPVIAVGLAVGVAAVSWYAVEKPILEYQPTRRRLVDAVQVEL